MAMAMGMASLFSCSSDDEGAESHPASGDVTSFDQVKYLQDNIIETDSVGNIVQRVCGKKMNAADTTELTIGVSDINAASAMFKSWLSPDTKTELISPSTVDMQAELADANGVVKETVYFKAADGTDKTIAEVTFKNGGVLKHFSKIKFTRSLPFKSYSQYAVGDCVKLDTYEDGQQYWVCVREASDGVSGLLVYLSKKKKRPGTLEVCNFASPSLARAASESIRSNDNWNSFVEFFKAADMNLESGEYYWIDDTKMYVVGIYAIRLSDGDIDWFDVVTLEPFKYNIQVKTFGLVDD